MPWSGWSERRRLSAALGRSKLAPKRPPIIRADGSVLLNLNRVSPWQPTPRYPLFVRCLRTLCRCEVGGMVLGKQVVAQSERREGRRSGGEERHYLAQPWLMYLTDSEAESIIYSPPHIKT